VPLSFEERLSSLERTVSELVQITQALVTAHQANQPLQASPVVNWRNQGHLTPSSFTVPKGYGSSKQLLTGFVPGPNDSAVHNPAYGAVPGIPSTGAVANFEIVQHHFQNLLPE
jgi:hypothetical protein